MPVAFWAWQSKSPSAQDIKNIIEQAQARTLFLRAGQVDTDGGTIKRIRPLDGDYPTGIEIHLVYNATANLLKQLDESDPVGLATAIIGYYRQDAERAAEHGAQVKGLQLDIDYPTRLLPHYEIVVTEIRRRLSANEVLSITGLPTWMTSKALKKTLAATDFWIPQCYGAQIPARLDLRIPISSPQLVAETVSRASALKHPFYAGLSAYGYTLHYDRNGRLINLRADIDPAQVVANRSLKMMARESFGGSNQATTSEWRYFFRAISNTVINNLVVREGESLVVDLPNVENLRESAKKVRELSGQSLLGICVFRLPSASDPTTLSIGEVVTALNDQKPQEKNVLKIEPAVGGDSNKVVITISNQGSTRSLMGDDAVTVDLRLPAAMIRSIRLDGFNVADTHCASSPGLPSQALPCSSKLANLIRLKAYSWKPGDSARAYIEFAKVAPKEIVADLTVQTDTNRIRYETRKLVF